MKRLIALIVALMLLSIIPVHAESGVTVIEPQWPVPDYVTWLLDIARGELGYTEGDHGYSKYGEWRGDPYAQWCAEYLCWSVDQVDQRYGTQLLHHIYPLYSGTNTGKNWFIRQGRYIARNGNLEPWGYQWLKGENQYITTGSYIPQPGDWVFFTWTSGTDTDHVAMVEYCTRDQNGQVTMHVLEGNAPSAVQRTAYDITNTRILGYGTVHDVADWTMRGGCSGEKVRQLQENLIYLGYLSQGHADGVYGAATAEAIRLIQQEKGIRQTGIANIATQQVITEKLKIALYNDPDTWFVVDDEEEF